MKTIEQVWEAGRRQHVLDCLARNEFPYRGWDKDYPHLAAQRMVEITDSSRCPDCGNTPETGACFYCKAD